MKVNYKNQLILTVVIILLFNTLNMIFHYWVFSSAGKILCGLLWLIHPVIPGGVTPSKRYFNLIRLAGAFLIIWGLMSRLYL